MSSDPKQNFISHHHTVRTVGLPIHHHQNKNEQKFVQIPPIIAPAVRAQHVWRRHTTPEMLLAYSSKKCGCLGLSLWCFLLVQTLFNIAIASIACSQVATMIPVGDHNSRSVLLRRVSSWSQMTLGDSGSVSSGDDALLMRPLLPELEYEQAPPPSDSSLVSETTRRRCSKVNFKLWVVFALLVVSGVANVIFLKMQALPM